VQEFVCIGSDAMCSTTVALLYCTSLKATTVNLLLAHFTAFLLFTAKAMIPFMARGVG